MSYIYTRDKEKRVTIRLSSNLLGKIESSELSGCYDLSKRIRALIEAGLSIPPQTLHNGGDHNGGEGQPFKRRWEHCKGWRTYEEIKESE